METIEPNPFENVDVELQERRTQQDAIGNYILDGGEADPPEKLAQFILARPDLLSGAIDAKGIRHDLGHATRIGKLVRAARALQPELNPPSSESKPQDEPKTEPRYHRA